jgi:hypothetical protein
VGLGGIKDDGGSLLHLSVSVVDVLVDPSFGWNGDRVFVSAAQQVQLFCRSYFNVLGDILGFCRVPSLLGFLLLVGTPWVVTDPCSDDGGWFLSFVGGFRWILVDERHPSRLVLVIAFQVIRSRSWWGKVDQFKVWVICEINSCDDRKYTS